MLLLSLGISVATTEKSPTLTTYTFSADLPNETDWEIFLMTFQFLCNETRAANRMRGNRTIIISADDGNNTSTVVIDINVLPLPPAVFITVPPNIIFTEGENYTLFRNLDNPPISVTQDEDSQFILINVTLRYCLLLWAVIAIISDVYYSITQLGYSPGPTEMISDFRPPVSMKIISSNNIDIIISLEHINSN